MRCFLFHRWKAVPGTKRKVGETFEPLAGGLVPPPNRRPWSIWLEDRECERCGKRTRERFYSYSLGPVQQSPERPEAGLARWVTPSALEMAKSRVEGSCSKEVLHMLAALIALADDTRNHAEEQAADGFVLTAEETRDRAARYEASAEALCDIWGRMAR